MVDINTNYLKVFYKSFAGEDESNTLFYKEIITNHLEVDVDGLGNAAKYSVSVFAFVADYEVTRDKHGNISIINIQSNEIHLVASNLLFSSSMTSFSTLSTVLGMFACFAADFTFTCSFSFNSGTIPFNLHFSNLPKKIEQS